MNIIDNGKDKIDEGQQAPYLNEWIFSTSKMSNKDEKKKRQNTTIYSLVFCYFIDSKSNMWHKTTDRFCRLVFQNATNYKAFVFRQLK